jgi:hypothetical protein
MRMARHPWLNRHFETAPQFALLGLPIALRALVVQGAGGGELLAGEFEDGFPEVFARLEFHHGPLGDGNIDIRGIRISAGSGLAQSDFKNSEIAYFKFAALGDGLCNLVQRELNHVCYLLEFEAALLADS